MVKINLFQFHKGTIRTDSVHAEYRQIKSFQFHKGTIRTRENSKREW